jgi:all-trans-retinol 13,14-reductase
LTALRVNNPSGQRPLYISCNRQKPEETSKFSLVAICPATYAKMNRWSDSSTGKRPEDYLEFKEEIGNKLRSRIEACCPQISETLKFTEIATPLTLRDFSNNPFGSLYGVKHKVGQYNPLPLTKAEGLYLAGQAIVAPGVLGAIISAFLVCGFIFGHGRLLKQLNKFK